MGSKSRIMSLNTLNNNLSYNIMSSNVDNTIEQKRKRGMPNKPSKIDVGANKLNEIQINNYVSNIFKKKLFIYIKITN